MSIHEIRVSKLGDNPGARDVEKRAASMLGVEIGAETTRTFYVEGVTDGEAATLQRELLVDPVTQGSSIKPRTDWSNPYKIQVDPLPGVMNTDSEAVGYGAAILGIEPIAIQSGTEYKFDGLTGQDVIDRVVDGMLVNGTVDHVRRQPAKTFEISGEVPGTERFSVASYNDNQLMELSKARKLALNLEEMKAIKAEAKRMGRDLTDGELEYLGGAWSEHCCHKTFNAKVEVDGKLLPPLFQRIKDISKPFFPERGVLSAFDDNSGVFGFYDGQAICVKLETHNSPMNLEPYGGAATGSGGVFRDIAGTAQGAKVINSQHMQYLAPLDLRTEDIPPGCHSPEYLLSRSVAAVRDYGNRMGIPTNNGSFHTHPNYRGKGSILVGAMGILPEQRAQKGKPQKGDYVVAVGGKTGRDGIHGATFSSESADSETATVHSGAVQIGDPITEKKVFDAIEEAADLGLIRAITDCGAAGFGSAVGEMGEDTGVFIDLGRAPLKYDGLAPWEIFLSESQERMVLAVSHENQEELAEIFKKHGSEAKILGEFGYGNEPRLKVDYFGRTLVDLDYDFIKNGLPDQTMRAKWERPDVAENRPANLDWGVAFKKVLSNGNVCSKEPIVRQYDHEVQGTNAMKPYGGVKGDGPNDAAVLTPILDKKYAVIEAHGSNPALSDLDPAWGSIWSFTEAMSNFVAAGGNPDDAVLVNNYISPTPTEQVMGALNESVNALSQCVETFRAPIISGKDSLSSTFKFDDGEVLESPYNLIITVAGKIPDVEKTITTDIKKPGSTLVLIGKQDTRMGGSVFYDEAGGSSGKVPRVFLDDFYNTAKGLHQAIQTGKVLSAHDVSEGGLAVTISEMLFGGDCGAEVDLPVGFNPQNALFSETAGCFVVEVEDEKTVKELFGDLQYRVIGKTTEEKYLVVSENNISGRKSQIASLSVDELKAEWKKPLEKVFG